MKKRLEIFSTLVAVGFLTGCMATQPTQRENSEATAMLGPLKKESEDIYYKLAAIGKEDEVTRELGNGLRHDSRQYADWTAMKITDPQAKPQVLVCSRFYPDGIDTGESQFCFRFYSKEFVVVEPQGVNGKGYWPYCEYDHIPYHVDDKDPGVVPTIKGGLCSDDLDMEQAQFIQELKDGKTLNAQLNSSRGKVQLNGFGSAWDYAIAQF